MSIEIKSFTNPEDEFNWLADNQELFKAQRRSSSKLSDGHSFGFISFAVDEKGEIIKADNNAPKEDVFDNGVLKVKCIINATNILDSHSDVHIPGIWKKSLSEKKLIYLCQEHQLTFKGIISDKVKAYTETFKFKDIGYDYEGETECLVFDAVIKKERNEFMYEQYQKGYVRNHSVKMEYVSEYFCMNSDNPEHTQFKDNYNKYSKMIANQDDLKTVTWFYAVTQAKIKDEGSAVVKGSCFTTPTLEVIQENKGQAAIPAPDNIEPPESTQTRKKVFIN